MNFIPKSALLFVFVLASNVCNNVHIATGLARFTKVPPNVLHASVGKTARFVWDYTVDDRIKNFQTTSPTWSFYGPNNSESIIGYEDIFQQRKWSINTNTCPKRLLNPTRVGIESNATLVIQNITVADGGTYGCSLLLASRNPITSKARLIVTTIPKITLAKTNTSTIMIKESDSLDIRCSATGSPTPNVSWTNVALSNITISEGAGNVRLRINNITLQQDGWYECRASNNPDEAPVTMDLKIVVLFGPNIDANKSTRATASFKEKNMHLHCVATGQPLPRITWYGPRGRQIVSGIENKRGRSVLNFVTKNSSDFGQYRCHAENKVGKDEHFINVTQWISTVSTSVQRENRNKPTTYIGTRINTASTQVVIPKRRKHTSTRITPVVGAIIGVGLLIAIAIGLTLFIMTKKEKNKAKKRIENLCLSDIQDTKNRLEIPIYAEVDNSMIIQQKNGAVPIYAQVDKSKKKRPGQIVYAQLDSLQRTKERPSLMFPPKYKDTEYAEIRGFST